ncbi:integrase core domain-containing protein [Nitratireductor kimnyeongensis]|uniref:Integrase core domain-containing protein n=1 Tax=Nitratireductor kimnyeongensis TaxID=430679 RepID=A0ABW0T5J9_9HYPH
MRAGAHTYSNMHRSRFRDEFLNGVIFHNPSEMQILIERWRIQYNTKRPFRSLVIYCSPV